MTDYFEARLAEKDPPEPPLTTETLEKWWDLVTDPYHVKSEISQMPIAWKGAIENMGRK